MRSSFLLVVALLAFNLINNHSPSPARPPDRAISDHAALLDPIQIAGLTLIPIVETSTDTRVDILSLDEAMRARLLRVHEMPGGSVNELELANAADLPVFVLAGEVILGGKQDRIIGTNTVIPPHTTQTVPVFCVEHGRWRGETDEFTTAEVLAHDRLRGRANYATQIDVWDEVEYANGVHATANATGTYRALAAVQAADHASWERRIYEALAELPRGDRARMIGYAVAYGEDLVTVDMFASPALFAKLEQKLVRSYIAEAVDSQRRPARPPCVHAVRDFLMDADAGAVARSYETDAARTQIKRGNLVDSSHVVAGERHLYANYLGNTRADRVPPTPFELPTYVPHDRHLYPSYLGNSPHVPCPPRRDGRLRRTDDCR